MNCALWSAEVFEDDDGSLKNVHMAVIRGKQLVSGHILKKNQTKIVISRIKPPFFIFQT